MNTLIIDNNDSFTLNLAHLLAVFMDSEPAIINYRDIGQVEQKQPEVILISPGPGKPSDYPDYKAIFDGTKPVIGVCLGMQIMAEMFGGEVSKLPDCFHGRAEKINFDGRSFDVARYHSLAVTRVPECFRVISSNAAGVPMAMAHKSLPFIGYQFHPESFLTENGRFFIDYAFAFINTCHAGSV